MNDFFRVTVFKNNNSLTSYAYVKKSYRYDVVYITTQDVIASNTTKLVTQNININLYDKRTLLEFTDQFSFYIRISKSFVINIYFLDKYSEGFNFIWCANFKFQVSRKYKPELKKKIQEFISNKNLG